MVGIIVADTLIVIRCVSLSRNQSPFTPVMTKCSCYKVCLCKQCHASLAVVLFCIVSLACTRRFLYILYDHRFLMIRIIRIIRIRPFVTEGRNRFFHRFTTAVPLACVEFCPFGFTGRIHSHLALIPVVVEGRDVFQYFGDGSEYTVFKHCCVSGFSRFFTGRRLSHLLRDFARSSCSAFIQNGRLGFCKYTFCAGAGCLYLASVRRPYVYDLTPIMLCMLWSNGFGFGCLTAISLAGVSDHACIEGSGLFCYRTVVPVVTKRFHSDMIS